MMLKCEMADGPFCMPLEKYYTHSKVLYKQMPDERNSEKYGKLWLDAIRYATKDVN